MLCDKISRKTKPFITTSRGKIKTIQSWWYRLKVSNIVKDININNRIYYFFSD